MIGQKQLLQKLDKILQRFPKFSIVTGPKGSGKRTVAKHICKQLNLPIVYFGTGIDEIRNIIELSYEQVKPICYVCPDADNMSIGAKNSLLKITEEPPNNAYFILTLQDIGNTLETIKSRATVFALDNYSIDELIQYRQEKHYAPDFDYILKDVCSTTGEVDELFRNDIIGFYSFAKNVAENIAIPTTGNIFKIPKSVKTKETENGFDPILLFKAIRNIYIQKAIQTKEPKYLWASTVTSECLRDLALQSVNKVGTIDKWIMDVRVVLR